jgi:exodeoxyribonuclease VII small subunit
MTYDEAIKRIEQLVSELEASKAISMDAYLAKAKEAKELILFCQNELLGWEKKMEAIVAPEEA